jgi:hypothetical protein
VAFEQRPGGSRAEGIRKARAAHLVEHMGSTNGEFEQSFKHNTYLNSLRSQAVAADQDAMDRQRRARHIYRQVQKDQQDRLKAATRFLPGKRGRDDAIDMDLG